MDGMSMEERLWWLLHNVVGHPCMAILDNLGLKKLAFRVHEMTLPPHYRNRYEKTLPGSFYEE